MVKVIINGETHISAIVPRVALRDIEALTAAEKTVILASEDPSLSQKNLLESAKDRDAFVKNIEQMNRVISLLKEKDPALYDKIVSISDEDVIFSKDEISQLNSLLVETGLAKDIDNPMALVDFIPDFDHEMELFHGYERVISYEKYFANRLIDKTKPPVEVITIDDLDAVREIHDLQKVLKEGLDEETRKSVCDRLDVLYEDSEIEKRRISSMVESIAECASKLSADAIIYVYPIGNKHVAAVFDGLTAIAAERGDLEVFASCSYDSQEQKRIIPNTLAVRDDIPEFFLSSPRCGGYDESLTRIFPDVEFPELKPGLSVGITSFKSIKSMEGTKVTTAHGGAAAAAGGSSGRY